MVYVVPKFVDIYNFTKLFNRPDFGQAIINTVVIALAKIIAITVFSIIIALLTAFNFLISRKWVHYES